MHRDLQAVLLACVLAGCGGDSGSDGDGDTEQPFGLPAPPPTDVYDGALFQMSHDYPEAALPPSVPPWQEAIGFGSINTGNAEAYVTALKNFIATDMQTFLYDYDEWDPAARGWYNSPWLSATREPIRGVFVGSEFSPDVFPLSGLSEDLITYVFTYYNDVAAQSLERVWGDSGYDPVPGLEAGGAQFAEGSVVVKAAFVNVDGDAWPPMEGAFSTPIYASTTTNISSEPELQDVYLMQFDLIVKDTQSAPDTGWVFATLVYDMSVTGSNWQQMVPLGAMWGNDPDVISQPCDYLIPNDCLPLNQTWINPAAPLYSKETLGWGGRLSGPNDGSVDTDAAVATATGGIVPNQGRYAMSSCMSCHGVAEYSAESFLLPSPASCDDSDQCEATFAICDDSTCELASSSDSDARVVYYEAGTPEFMNWFQSRSGDVSQDDGTIALDYDMVFAFKALPEWAVVTGEDPSPNFVDSFIIQRRLPDRDPGED